MSDDRQLYGFFSLLARAKYGSAYYLGVDGSTVEVTCVDSDETGKDYLWRDKVAVGKVVRYSGKGARASQLHYYSHPSENLALRAEAALPER